MKRPLPKGAILHSEKAEKVFQGVRYSIYQWQQKLFNGKEATFETVKRNDSVIIVPVIGDKVVLTKELQPHLKEPFLGFPAGNVEDGEDLVEAAGRELEEETGMSFDDFSLVHVNKYMPGIEWFGYTYVATGYKGKRSTKFDGGEDIETLEVGFDELVKLVKRGAFRYAPRFIEERILRGEEKELFNLLKDPTKYRLQ